MAQEIPNDTISSLYLDNVKYNIKDNVSPASKITDDDITNWNNKWTYSKPSSWIPKQDLTSAVQTSLNKADSALQSYTETDPVFSASAASWITSTNITNWNNKQNAIDDLASIRSWAALWATALQSYTETDPIYSASVAAWITQDDVNSWDAKQNAISDLATIRDGASKWATALQASDITWKANLAWWNTFTWTQSFQWWASIDTNGYVTWSWLKSTANNHSTATATDIFVKQNWWLYTRTLAEIKWDLWVPTKVTDLSDASNYLTSETDPTVPSHVKSITSANISSWNNKLDKPSWWTEWQVLTKTATGTEWSDAKGWGNDTVYVTQEEYDALTPEENVDYVIYWDWTEDDEYATKKYVDENALPKWGNDWQVLTRVWTTWATWKDSTGWIWQETVWTTMKVDYLWLWTEDELSSLEEYKDWVVYLTIE